MKKGFTLVELIAIIIVLSVITTITFVSLTRSIKKSETQELDTYKEIVRAAAEVYVSLKGDEVIPEITLGNGYQILTSTLVEEGFIKSSISVPDKCPTSVVTVTQTNNLRFIYDVTCSNASPILLSVDNDSDGEMDPGDLIIIDDEAFYVISNVDGVVRALAQYNLNVGYDISYNNSDLIPFNIAGNSVPEFSSTYNAYIFSDFTYTKLNSVEIKQDSTKKGMEFYNNYTNFKSKGVISFDTITQSYYNQFGTKSYWKTNSAIYPMYVYDKYSSLNKYVDKYAARLTNKTAKIIQGDLISYEELVSLGCNTTSHSCLSSYVCSADDALEQTFFYDSNGVKTKCTSENQEIIIGGSAPSWVYSSTYWSGSAASDETVYSISNSGDFGGEHYLTILNIGLRPIIIFTIE